MGWGRNSSGENWRLFGSKSWPGTYEPVKNGPIKEKISKKSVAMRDGVTVIRRIIVEGRWDRDCDALASSDRWRRFQHDGSDGFQSGWIIWFVVVAIIAFIPISVITVKIKSIIIVKSISIRHFLMDCFSFIPLVTSRWRIQIATTWWAGTARFDTVTTVIAVE